MIRIGRHFTLEEFINSHTARAKGIRKIENQIKLE
jgi:hypothetical protein